MIEVELGPLESIVFEVESFSSPEPGCIEISTRQQADSSFETLFEPIETSLKEMGFSELVPLVTPDIFIYPAEKSFDDLKGGFKEEYANLKYIFDGQRLDPTTSGVYIFSPRFDARPGDLKTIK